MRIEESVAEWERSEVHVLGNMGTVYTDRGETKRRYNLSETNEA